MLLLLQRRFRLRVLLVQVREPERVQVLPLVRVPEQVQVPTII